MSQQLEAPIVLNPDSISQNWVSKNNFDLNENLVISFKVNSFNSADKEIGFGIFLADSESTEVFGATTVRGGLFDYSSKGEVGETIENLDTGDVDLLLDHVYPYNINSLIKNQNLTNNIFSIFIVNKIDAFKVDALDEIHDYYNNVYFDGYNTTGVDSPMLIQFGNTLEITNFKDETGEILDILNLQNYIFRISIINKGTKCKIDILKPGFENYKNISIRDINISTNYNNLKIGYSIASPLMTYDVSKKINNFNILDFHVQGKIK